MKWFHTFGTGRHKHQADITLLFQYIYITTNVKIFEWDSRLPTLICLPVIADCGHSWSYLLVYYQ